MKRLIFALAAVCMITPAFAQEVTRTEDDKTITVVEETQTPDGKVVTTTTILKDRIFVNGFWYNWELMGGLGTQLYYGENDWKVENKLEMFAFPSIDLYLTKWASPFFGVGLGANVSQFKGLYQNKGEQFTTRFKTNDAYTGKVSADYIPQNLTYQRGYYGNVFALAHTDLGNLFCGYKADRFFTVDLYAGGGLLFGLTDKAVGASFNVGMAPKFRITDQLSLMLNIRGALAADDFEGESNTNEPTEAHFLANHKMDGIAGATIGLSWKLGKKKSRWENASRESIIYYNDAALARRDSINLALGKDLADAQATIGDLRNQLANGGGNTEYISVVPDLWFHINFILDRWDLLNREKINLQSVADIMNSTPNVKYLLCGYADKQTATPEHNMMLSKNRVEAVYDYLTKELGVDPDQLVTDYKGGVDYMFYNEKELSRCCMITAIKE